MPDEDWDEKEIQVKQSIPVGSIIKVSLHSYLGDYNVRRIEPRVEIIRPAEVH